MFLLIKIGFTNVTQIDPQPLLEINPQTKRYSKLVSRVLLNVGPQTLLKINPQTLHEIDPQVLLEINPQTLLKLIHKRYSKY